MVLPLFCSNIMENHLESVLNKFISNPNQTEFNRLFYDLLKNEWTRLRSFYIRRSNNWPVSFLSPEDLANAGFFYLNRDRVQCAFCRGIVSNWERGDRPLSEHARHFPRCPFIMEEDVGNIPITTDPIRHIPPNRAPFHPSYQTTESRRRTFDRNFDSTVVNHDSLAEAGFFAVGIADYVKCFHCDFGLGTWVAGDDPWVEHAKYNPNCYFVYSNKGRGFINSCVRLLSEDVQSASDEIPSPADLITPPVTSGPSISEPTPRPSASEPTPGPSSSEPTSEPSSSSDDQPGFIQLTQALTNETDIIKCKICFDADISIVFLPCGHQMACTPCASHLDTCPICRKVIQKFIRTFFA